MKIFNNKIILLLLCGVALTLVSCVNEDDTMGLGFVKSNGGMDILSADNTNVTLEAASFKYDSLKTGTSDNLMLGTYRDGTFGRITASIYASLGITNSQFDFTQMTVDSAVLCLAYTDYFSADTSIKEMDMQVTVWELAAAIDSTDIYAQSEINTENSPIFNSVVSIKPLTSVYVDTAEAAPHLRIHLNDSFISKLKSRTFTSKEDFKEAFKGVKIEATAADANGMTVTINMKSDLSGIKIYYHNDSGNKAVYAVNFPSDGKKFMHIDYDYTSTPLSALALQGDSVAASQYMYLCCLGVSEITLNLKGLDTWYLADSVKGAALNRAELILPVADPADKAFLFPRAIQAYRMQDGKFIFTDDMIRTNWTGNLYDASIHAYRIDVTSFLQQYLIGKFTDCTLYLAPDVRLSSASRVVLNGPQNANPPKLNIIYSHPAN
ncbi:MAG: DUF4270 family protein [Bacteroidales bacterium]|nr:DUF4270 family protein [Bacteroidales bacterium]